MISQVVVRLHMLWTHIRVTLGKENKCTSQNVQLFIKVNEREGNGSHTVM